MTCSSLGSIAKALCRRPLSDLIFQNSRNSLQQIHGPRKRLAAGLNAPLKLNIMLIVVPLNTGVASAGGDARDVLDPSLDALYLTSSFRGTLSNTRDIANKVCTNCSCGI